MTHFTLLRTDCTGCTNLGFDENIIPFPQGSMYADREERAESSDCLPSEGWKVNPPLLHGTRNSVGVS